MLFIIVFECTVQKVISASVDGFQNWTVDWVCRCQQSGDGLHGN